MKKNYYLAINRYRDSTSNGFANTWDIWTCTRQQQIKALQDGLPISDQWRADGSPCCTTMGVRLATRTEIARAKRQALVGISYPSIFISFYANIKTNLRKKI